MKTEQSNPTGKSPIDSLRKEIRTILRARQAGSTGFTELAKLHKAKIKKARYRDLTPISDTMAAIGGKMVITHENLQYFPAKVRYFELK